MRATAFLLLAAFAASLLAGCGDDTYKPDPKAASTQGPRGGRRERD